MAGKKPNPEATALRDRWTPEQLERVLRAFGARTLFTPFAPVTIDGAEYQDLRGFTIREPIREVTLDHVDFSHARIDWVGAFIGVTVNDCLFTGALLDQNLGGTFRRCGFDEANLSGARVFGGSAFSECTFVRANLRQTKGLASFDRCDFSGADFKGTHFTDSEFRDCKWDDVRFKHSSLGGSTMTRAGFPVEKGVQAPDQILPDVILDHVKWLD